MEKVPGGQVGYGSIVVESSIYQSIVVGSGVVVGAMVVVVVVVVGVVVLERETSKPSRGFPPTMRTLSLGLTTGRLSLPWPNRAIPSSFTRGVPMRSGGQWSEEQEEKKQNIYGFVLSRKLIINCFSYMVKLYMYMMYV